MAFRKSIHPLQHRPRAARIGVSMLLVSMLAAAGSAVAEEAASGAQPVHRDPLQTPSTQAPLAPYTLLLDVTRAGDRLIAVGPYGHILYSNDGRSWQQASVPVSVTITAVDFADPEKGWAVGHQGVVLHSSDGGRSWTQQLDGMSAGQMWIDFADAQLAEAEAILAEKGEDDEEAYARWDAADLAASDAAASIEFGPAQPWLDVWFRNGQEGFVVGSYGQIFRTTDGGETWELRNGSIHNPQNFHYYDISPAPSGSLFLVGERGGVYRSDDQGENWQKLSAPYEDGSFYRTLSFAHDDEEVVLLFGFGGHLFRSTDQGESWAKVEVPTNKSINDGTVLTDGSVVLVGLDGVILRSKDGGRSFEQQVDRRGLPFTAIAGLSEDSALVLSTAGAEIVAVGGGEEQSK